MKKVFMKFMDKNVLSAYYDIAMKSGKKLLNKGGLQARGYGNTVHVIPSKVANKIESGMADKFVNSNTTHQNTREQLKAKCEALLHFLTV